MMYESSSAGQSGERFNTAVIVYDDRIKSGERTDKFAARISDYPLNAVSYTVIEEDAEKFRAALTAALNSQARVILTLGGTGLRAANRVPDVTKEFIDRELTGLETQILLVGLENTSRASLSRAVIGTTDTGKLIVNCPSSSGGIKDTLGIVIPLLEPVFDQLDETD